MDCAEHTIGRAIKEEERRGEGARERIAQTGQLCIFQNAMYTFRKDT